MACATEPARIAAMLAPARATAGPSGAAQCRTRRGLRRPLAARAMLSRAPLPRCPARTGQPRRSFSPLGPRGPAPPRQLPGPGRARRAGAARAAGPLEMVAAVSLVGAAALFIVIPIAVTATVVASTAAAVSAVVLALFTPLLPLVLASAGLASLSVPILWGAVDRLLCVVVAANFAFGALSMAVATRSRGESKTPQLLVAKELGRKVPRKLRSFLKKSGMDVEVVQADGAAIGDMGRAPSELRRGFWLLPSLLSLVPGAHGSAWLVAFANWPEAHRQRWDFQAGLLRNALVYGGVGLLGLLLGHPFGAPAVKVASCAAPFGLCFLPFWPAGTTTLVPATTYSASFWLSLVLGATHLQLDRAWLQGLGSSRRKQAGGKMQKQETAAGTVVDVERSAQDEATERNRRELDEFDARLRLQTEGAMLGKSVEDWTVAEVALWLGETGMREHVEAFRQHDIDGRVLLALSEEDLRTELGMERLGQRKRLLQLIQELQSQPGSAADS